MIASALLLLPDFLLIALGAALRRVRIFDAPFWRGLERFVYFVPLAAVPTAPSSYILAMQMNGMGAPVALLISSGTLLAIATLPLWLALIA